MLPICKSKLHLCQPSLLCYKHHVRSRDGQYSVPLHCAIRKPKSDLAISAVSAPICYKWRQWPWGSSVSSEHYCIEYLCSIPLERENRNGEHNTYWPAPITKLDWISWCILRDVSKQGREMGKSQKLQFPWQIPNNHKHACTHAHTHTHAHTEYVLNIQYSESQSNKNHSGKSFGANTQSEKNHRTLIYW